MGPIQPQYVCVGIGWLMIIWSVTIESQPS
jgi:hypothetical protein